jgi:cytochrome c oxidase subunit 2
VNKFAHKSTLYFALVTIAAVLALSACGGNNNNNASESPTTPSTSSAPAAGGATKDITVTATNFQFDQTEIKVNKYREVDPQERQRESRIENPRLRRKS